LKENTAKSIDYKGNIGFDERFCAKVRDDFCIKVFFILYW